MQRNIRILTKPNDGDKFVKIKIDQSFDFLEVLSLKLTQADVYRKFASDYGVIVGRVIANGGFGVPNARVSVFIPIDDNEPNQLISEIYPYRTVKDTNSDGVRYNLLPDESIKDCHTAVGTFPSKRKILDNDVWLEIYEKYYKFTTTTNFAGDYMIFGVPIGSQNIHMDVDISDMEFISVKPYDLIEQGYNENLFESRTTFKGGTDLGSLVQVQSRDYALNVIPFWGDLQEGEVGVNRVDFNLDLEIIPNATFFGSIFTDSKKSSLRKKCGPRKTLGKNCDLATGTGRIEMIRRVSNDSNEVEFMELESKQIDENGNWAFTVPMNLNRVVTDEFGNLIPSEDPNIGIPTTTNVRFRLSLEEHGAGLKYRTASYLVPNMYNRFEFGDDTPDFEFFEMRWKKVYTVTNYIPRYQKFVGANTRLYTGIKDIGECENTSPFPFNRVSVTVNFLFTILCILISLFGVIINFINNLIRVVLFEVLITFMCYLKHPFNPGRRSACRCQGCFNLENGLLGNSNDVPDGWIPPATTQCSTCIECAVCYDAGDDSALSTTYSFKTGTILTPSWVDPGSYVNGVGATAGTWIVFIGSSIFSVTINGSAQITNVIIYNQTGYTDNPTEVVNIPAGSLGGSDAGYSFTITNEDIYIFGDFSAQVPGVYNDISEAVSAPGYTYSGGTGNSVKFDITIDVNGRLSSITIDNGNGGSGYSYFSSTNPTQEIFTTIESGIGTVGGTGLSFGFAPSAFNTSLTVNSSSGPITVDCEALDFNDCAGLCTGCPVTIITLDCNDVTYTDAIEWANCVKENLAEDLGVIKYHFYNDWVIGSLYAILFDYKVRFKKKGKSFERFCDFDCRAPGVPVPAPNTPNYEHRRNRCYDSYIAEENVFGMNSLATNCTVGDWELVKIDAPDNTDNGRGLIVEYNNRFYYSARHDVEINTANLSNNLTVDEKYNLLFATNIIELGSMVSCDLDGEPYLVDRLESTTYQKDDGVGTLFDISDCFSACPINRNGVQLMSQAGVEIAFAEVSDNLSPIYVGDDGENYYLDGVDTAVPDYDSNPGVIIFDRDDVILRRTLCENFNYYGISGVYTSTERPTIGDSFIREDGVATGDTLEFTTDVCAGFDDNGTYPTQKMHPYYMYFGIRQGQSSLDKLRKFYFDRCVD